MTKTRKNRKSRVTQKNVDDSQCKLKLKSCKAALYKSVYGGASGGSIRKPIQASFY
jgi:hypothetical protein